MRNRVRSPWDSCQLDSGLDDLSCVRSPTRGHREVLSQMRCPGGRGAGAGVAGAALGALLAVLALRIGRSREPGAVPDGARGGTAAGSLLPAPDISQMSPEERATRLYNRVMTLHSQGKADSAEFFLPMALQA